MGLWTSKYTSKTCMRTLSLIHCSSRWPGQLEPLLQRLDEVLSSDTDRTYNISLPQNRSFLMFSLHPSCLRMEHPPLLLSHRRFRPPHTCFPILYKVVTKRMRPLPHLQVRHHTMVHPLPHWNIRRLVQTSYRTSNLLTLTRAPYPLHFCLSSLPSRVLCERISFPSRRIPFNVLQS